MSMMGLDSIVAKGRTSLQSVLPVFHDVLTCKITEATVIQSAKKIAVIFSKRNIQGKSKDQKKQKIYLVNCLV